MKGKKGLSPVVATMLLVGIVIVIGLIVFMWARGITEEAVTKFDGTNIKLVCDEVSFLASYSSNQVSISNNGNVPIYRMKAKIFKDGEFSTETIENNWPDAGLNQGGAISSMLTAGNKILLIPVLVGHSERGNIEYTCEERHGLEIITY